MTAPGARVVAQGCRYLGDGVTRTWSRWSGGRHEWTWEDARLVYLISLGGGTYGSAELVGSGVGGPPPRRQDARRGAARARLSGAEAGLSFLLDGVSFRLRILRRWIRIGA